MRPRWVYYTHKQALTCPSCGGEVAVYTSLEPDQIKKGIYEEDDEVICRVCDDLIGGVIAVNDDEIAWIRENL